MSCSPPRPICRTCGMVHSKEKHPYFGPGSYARGVPDGKGGIKIEYGRRIAPHKPRYS